MTRLGLSVCTAAMLAASAATADPLSTPAMTGPLTANPNPLSFNAGFGTIYVTGALTGLAQYQSNPEHAGKDDGTSMIDLDNAFISVQKTDGLFQFYVQAGLYAFPTVGEPYARSIDNTQETLGYVPVGYGKLQLSDTFSVEAGKLPTLIGAEYADTTENMNIERGLLWWQEPISSRGVQANYASGPLSISLSWNDGYYTNVWNTGSGLISYAFNAANTLAFAASVTPKWSYNGGNQIYNLMYTYNSAPWVFGPYLQYQHFDGASAFFEPSSSDWGIGALASYQFNPNWSLTGRVEYEDSSGSGFALPYGPKSSAWSVTATPTWQKSLFFIRGEISYTTLSSFYHYSGDVADSAPVSDPFSYGYGFGWTGTKSGQFRALLETGIVF